MNDQAWIISVTFSQIPHTIELSLEGPDKDVFSVEPSFMSSDSLVQLLVKQPEVLDFEEKQQMTLEVRKMTWITNNNFGDNF